MFSLDERYELYFYKKEERMIGYYIIFLLLLLFAFFMIGLVPYQKKESIIGVTEKIDNKIVVQFRIKASKFLKIHSKKVMIEKKYYFYQIVKTDFLNSEEFMVLIQIKLPKHYQKENVPISLFFDSEKTTILHELENKMKGWFL